MRGIVLNHIPFFQTRVTKIHIDPSLYDKEEIIKTVYENYNKSPCRNVWDDTSNLHHYYDDWNNSKFSQVNLDRIKKVYNHVFQKFIDSITFKQDLKYEYKWNIENITVYNQEQFMQAHDHLGDNCIYSAVHYISVSNNSAPITFINPLLALPEIEKTSKFLNPQDPQNSTYFAEWNIKPKEDYMIVFPSYLRHKVIASKNNEKDSKLRISVVSNIELF